MKDSQRAATVYRDEISFTFEHLHPQVGKAESVSAQACGKAIIVGEHAVVYGASAVAMPLLNHCMKIVLSPQVHHGSKPLQLRLMLDGREMSPLVSSVMHDAFQVLGINQPFSLIIEGSHCLPIGAGLGSSATLCIIVLRAISRSLGLNIPASDLARLGNIMEARFHGKPSGLDTAVVALEKVILFKKETEPQVLHAQKIGSSPWRFAIIDSGVRSSTLTMIKKAGPYFQSATQGEKRLQRFDSLSLQVASGLTSGHLEQVAEGMNEAGQMLAEAGTVNEQLASIIEICREVGALAAKPTGAGGGGAVLSLLNPEFYREQLAALKDKLKPLQLFAVDLP